MARISNLPLFLKKFQPERIIISAKDMHGHPSWQFMVIILAYMMHERHCDPDVKPPCLFTCLPYWLLPIFFEPGKEDLNKNVDMGQFAGEEEFQALRKNKKAAAIHFTNVTMGSAVEWSHF
ncbi:hypothetical protein LY78DRAFT_675094 [Colletotrichum sublineola]|nr:hypothetical protein LY78DRAFT_675094 [Colletotrichum sublineola]